MGSKEESSNSLNQGRGSGEITASTTAASIATTATMLTTGNDLSQQQPQLQQRDSVEEAEDEIGYI